MYETDRLGIGVRLALQGKNIGTPEVLHMKKPKVRIRSRVRVMRPELLQGKKGKKGLGA